MTGKDILKSAFWAGGVVVKGVFRLGNCNIFWQQGDPIAYSIQSEMYNQWTNSSVMGPAEVQYEMQKIKYLLQQNAATDAQCDNA